MEPHSPRSTRFSDTPPGSPKSCMKGSRKLTFENPSEVATTTTVGGGNPSPIPSPKRSPKSVSIRMHEDGGGGGGEGSPRAAFDLPSTSSASSSTEATAGPSSSSSDKKKISKAPPDIQFQFQLTEHFDQSTPPPNCTSNGNYDFEPEKQEPATSSTSSTYDDPRKDPQLVEIANKFVNDIIEDAKIEAANRSKAEPSRGIGREPGTSGDRDSFSNGIRGVAGGWYRRAHGTVSKWITTICVRAQNIRADLK